MTGLGGKMVWTMTYVHRPHCISQIHHQTCCTVIAEFFVCVKLLYTLNFRTARAVSHTIHAWFQPKVRNERKFLWSQYLANAIDPSNRKFVPVGSIPSNQIFLLFIDKDVNWQLDQTEKTQCSPAGDRTWVFRLPVGRSDHWATTPLQEFARSSCRGFVAQWSERPTGNHTTQVWSPAGLRCVFSVWSSCQLTSLSVK